MFIANGIIVGDGIIAACVCTLATSVNKDWTVAVLGSLVGGWGVKVDISDGA